MPPEQGASPLIAIDDANQTATDDLGRKLPTFSEVGAPKPNRWVGMFYWQWHGDDRWLPNGLWDGAKVQGGDSDAGSVGVMYSEFPEAGVASASFRYAFLGAQVGTDGLTLTPRVPSELQSVRAADIDFRGATFDLEASKTALQIRCTANP